MASQPPPDVHRQRRVVLNHRAAEFLAGSAAVVFSATVALSWTLARGLNIGTTAINAVTWMGNLGWVAFIVGACTLGWCINDAAHGRPAAHKLAAILQAVGFAVATVMVGGITRSISLVSVYQKGEGNPTINSATVATAFAWVWTFVWTCMRSWNDAHFARADGGESATPAAASAAVATPGGGAGEKDKQDAWGPRHRKFRI